MNIIIDERTERRLWAFIESVDTEIGGFGYGWRQPDQETIVWDSVFLVPQIVSGSEVSFDAESLAAAVETAAADDVLDKPEFVWVSWHSHHTMKAFWSGTDEKCIQTYGAAGIKSLVSFVGCHDHEYRLRYDGFGIEHDGLVIPQVTIDGMALESDAIDAVAAEIEQFVSVRKPPAIKRWPRPSLPGAKVEAALVVADELDDDEIGPGWSYFDAWPEVMA